MGEKAESEDKIIEYIFWSSLVSPFVFAQGDIARDDTIKKAPHCGGAFKKNLSWSPNFLSYLYAQAHTAHGTNMQMFQLYP